MKEIDKLKAISKWSPVLESLEIKDKKTLEWLSIYAEYTSMRESEKNVDNGNNYLPVSLKIASKLELNDIDIDVMSIPADMKHISETYQFVIKIPKNFVEDIRYSGKESEHIESMESILIEHTIEEINKILKGKKIFRPYDIVSSISILLDDIDDAKMIFRSRFYAE